MNREAITEAFFDEYCVAAADQIVEWSSAALAPRRSIVERLTGTLAVAGLVAILQCLCARELERRLKTYDEMPVAMQIHCEPHAPVVEGARMRMTGWVESADDRGVTFRVKAQDEQEQICDGRIRFALVPRAENMQTLERKREAIMRREMFTPA